MKLTLHFLIKEYFNKITIPSLFTTIMLSVFGVFSVMGNTKAQIADESRISIKLNQVSLVQSLNVIENKAGCVINYNPAIFKNEHRVSIDVKDMPLGQVLRKVLEGTGVTYKMSDTRTVLLYKLPDPVKPGRITGKVLDETGEPLPGAGVRIQELNRSVSSGVDGSFSIAADPGTYTVEISYVSYQGRKVTGVTVKSGESTPLNISLKPVSATLSGVVIVGDYKKTSVEGLLARQKNAAEMSNGISAEQISKTPDANLGEALKRITGISTVDNKYVIVRGMGERYNMATLDGTPLPSTEANRRSFSFDLIPSNLIDNVTVSKTITPDMNTSFGGGLVQINTKDIPASNFMSLSIGSAYNDMSTGKDFYSTKRGKYDYFGFDDGRRDFPKDLKFTAEGYESTPEKPKAADKFEQSRLFKNDNFTLYKSPAPIAQNYQFSIGRVNNIDTNKVFGIIGSLSFRNSQNITEISDFRRGMWLLEGDNHGNFYNFNTTWGAILNAGLKLANHRISLRNTYTRRFDNDLSLIRGYLETSSPEDMKTIPPIQRMSTNPIFLDLLQNKVALQHQLGRVKVEWEVARTGITRDQKDVVRQDLYPQKVDNEYILLSSTTYQPSDFPNSRHHYYNKETDYNWNISGSMPFKVAGTRGVLKSGYAGNHKQLSYNWQGAQLNDIFGKTPQSLLYLPFSEKIKAENLNPNGFVWEVQPWLIDRYAGKSEQHAGFLMLDNRFTDQLRLVWGVRAEYYKYTEIQNPTNASGGGLTLAPKPDPAWRWMPSANLTYSPTQKLNLRAAYSRTVIRPEFLERTQFQMYDPELNGLTYSLGLTSTRIDGFDLRAELFPDLGEIISVGAFYRYFDQPVERTKTPGLDGRSVYPLKNSKWAKNYGVELEFRKRLNFFSDLAWLDNFTVFGNATYTHSEVQTEFLKTDDKGNEVRLQRKNTRPLYGQTPYMFNAGLQYEAKRFGVNLVFNRTGRKMYIVAESKNNNEFQRPYSQLDGQLSYKFLKSKLEVKLNIANLLNQRIEFYSNSASYRQARPEDGIDLGDDQSVLIPGYSDNYEKGDLRTFTQRFGRTYSLQLIYNF